MKFEMNGKTIDLMPQIKRYVNGIELRLALPLKTRAKVMQDVTTGIILRHEAGESYEAIMQDMGTPRQVAQGINREMADFTYRKSPWRWVFLALALAAAAFLLYDLGMGTVANVIGGADGPTAIVVTGHGFFDYNLMHTLAVWALPLGLVLFVWLGHLRPEKNGGRQDD